MDAIYHKLTYSTKLETTKLLVANTIKDFVIQGF